MTVTAASGTAAAYGKAPTLADVTPDKPAGLGAITGYVIAGTIFALMNIVFCAIGAAGPFTQFWVDKDNYFWNCLWGTRTCVGGVCTNVSNGFYDSFGRALPQSAVTAGLAFLILATIFSAFAFLSGVLGCCALRSADVDGTPRQCRCCHVSAQTALHAVAWVCAIIGVCAGAGGFFQMGIAITRDNYGFGVALAGTAAVTCFISMVTISCGACRVRKLGRNAGGAHKAAYGAILGSNPDNCC